MGPQKYLLYNNNKKNEHIKRIKKVPVIAEEKEDNFFTNNSNLQCFLKREDKNHSQMNNYPQNVALI